MRVLVSSLVLASTAAFASPELAQHFAKQADLSVEHDRLVMLVLPPEVLAETQPDLSDVRITDREGREVPFFVEASAAPPPAAVRYAPPRVRAVAREIRSPEGESPYVSERYELSLPEAGRVPGPGERVQLCVAS